MASLVNNGNDVFYSSGTSLAEYEQYSRRRLQEEQNRCISEVLRDYVQTLYTPTQQQVVGSPTKNKVLLLC